MKSYMLGNPLVFTNFKQHTKYDDYYDEGRKHKIYKYDDYYESTRKPDGLPGEVCINRKESTMRNCME